MWFFFPCLHLEKIPFGSLIKMSISRIELLGQMPVLWKTLLIYFFANRKFFFIIKQSVFFLFAFLLQAKDQMFD